MPITQIDAAHLLGAVRLPFSCRHCRNAFLRQSTWTIRLSDRSAALSVLTSAGDFYGGFIGALNASAFFFPTGAVLADCGHVRAAIALGQAIGRICV